ncbi:aminotransferase class V-fold PLP-dependent enzyme [Paracrocinitomix mangrovi]|uniref:pyridoxal phosphate-dependent decarboxylase family protein n=1 Tax=Paracrocinitomix mangrovi TaxID=2862509 RepID=UPI001EDA53AD|nr:aminotransferase class V-fold PLP-dependent enzyme [Paracrocinitomix mangrovi]UKN02030.1 aminotransferase class V-fold PLP-dependent enzyme [Paracrocinitomix mangrovi]
MAELLKKLADLEKLSAPLEPNQDERAHYFQQVKNWSDHYIANIDKIDSFYDKLPDTSKLSIDEKQHSIEELLDIYHTEVTETGIVPSHGGHIGYIPGGGIYLSAIADYIADVSNEYAGMFYGGPGAVTIENELINWMKGVFRFPESAVGNLTSGGSIANLIALTAARDFHGVKNEKVTSSVIYLSEQVHHCTQKALRIIGLEDAIIRYIPLDEKWRMDATILEQTIKQDKAEGLYPFVVLASAGTTDTGAIDPLKAIGKIAQQHNLWYHIDGAYGGFFILTDRAKDEFEGIEMADSLCIDPHKGLFLPYGLGAVLIKNKEALFHSHHYTANYMQDALNEDWPLNPADVSPELTKHFRGLRMWLPLKVHGLAPFKACLEEKLYLTDYFREELVKRGFKVGPEPDLSVSYFWFPVTENENQNQNENENQNESESEFNERLMDEIHKDGRIFLSSTRLNGKYVIRMAILSFRTKKHTIDTCLEMIDRCLERVRN